MVSVCIYIYTRREREAMLNNRALTDWLTDGQMDGWAT